MFKYQVFSGPYFPVFGLNTGKYGPEKTPYPDTSSGVGQEDIIVTIGMQLQMKRRSGDIGNCSSSINVLA